MTLIPYEILYPVADPSINWSERIVPKPDDVILVPPMPRAIAVADESERRLYWDRLPDWIIPGALLVFAAWALGA